MGRQKMCLRIKMNSKAINKVSKTHLWQSMSKSTIYCILIFFRSSHQRCFIKKVFLKISRNSQVNTCARVSFLIKFWGLQKKEALAKMFSCEFCEVFKNTFFSEHLRTTASDFLPFIQFICATQFSHMFSQD